MLCCCGGRRPSNSREGRDARGGCHGGLLPLPSPGQRARSLLIHFIHSLAPSPAAAVSPAFNFTVQCCSGEHKSLPAPPICAVCSSPARTPTLWATLSSSSPPPFPIELNFPRFPSPYCVQLTFCPCPFQKLSSSAKGRFNVLLTRLYCLVVEGLRISLPLVRAFFYVLAPSPPLFLARASCFVR